MEAILNFEIGVVKFTMNEAGECTEKNYVLQRNIQITEDQLQKITEFLPTIGIE